MSAAHAFASRALVSSSGSRLFRALAGASFVVAVSAAPSIADKANDTLNAAFAGEIATLDFYKESGREGIVISRLLYDSLLNKDRVTGEFKPEIAESFKFVDPTTIDFVIRKDVKFHDGTMLTADDVVYTLNTVSSKAFGARYQISVEWIASAEKIGEDGVRLKMKQPYPLALEMLAGNVPIYPKAYYEKVGSQGMSAKPVGTGPYRLVESTPGSRYVFEAFDGYYPRSPKGAAKIKQVVVRTIPEPNTQYAELINGGLDWIWRVPPDDARNLGRRKNVEIRNAEIMRFGFIMMNPNYGGGKSPLADARVRRAINLAVDKAAIVKSLVGGAAKTTPSACNPIQFGCTSDVTTYAYDPAKAKALLAEAGFADGFKMELTIAAMPRAQAEAIAGYLAKVGVVLSLNEQQYASAVSAWRDGKAGMVMTNWGSYGIGDAGLSTGLFFAGAGDDNVKDPELVAWLKEANSSIDPAARKEFYGKALRKIADETYWLPLWTYSVATAQNKDLELNLGADEFVDFFRATWK